MSEKLTKSEKELVKEQEELVRELVECANYIKGFNLNDYVMLYDRYFDDDDNLTDHPVTNSYGSPIKYKVVHVSAAGMPYLKRLGPKAVPIGRLIAVVDLRHSEGQEEMMPTSDDYIGRCNTPIFKVDPDFTDSVILNDEAAYDPNASHRNKSAMFKEITKHNKAIKVKTNEDLPLFQWILTLKAGDTFWRSPSTMMTVTEVKTVPSSSDWRYEDYRATARKLKMKGVPKITLTDSKGKTTKWMPMDFWRTAIYTQQPRSYRDMKDPIL